LERARRAGKYLLVQPFFQANLARIHLIFTAEHGDPSYARNAAEIVEQGLEYAPNGSELRLVQGTTYLTIAEFTRDEADIEKAVESLEAAHKRTPLLLTVNEDLLEAYMLKGDYRAVLETADFVGSFKENETHSMVARAVALEALGRRAEAERLYKETLELHPGVLRLKKRLVALRPDASRTKSALGDD
jgi:tetratricopeptide (TPR) repeat protein